MKHLKLFFALFAMLALGVTNAWAEEVSIDFSQQGYSNQQAITDATITDGITITFSKGSNSNAPKYYASGTAIRAYGGNTFTISSTIGNITKIVLTFGSSDGTNAISADNGTFNSPNWTGEKNSVTFTIGGTSGNRRLKAMTITYTPSAGGEDPGTGGEEPETPDPGAGGEALSYTWDLSTNSYSAASTNQVTWSAADVNMVIDKASAQTNANNYLPTAKTSTRFYKNSNLTITPAANVTITSMVFAATTTDYASVLKNSTWTNASASVSGTTVTVTPTNGASAISATIGGTCGFTGVTVHYTKAASGEPEPVIVKTLKSIAVTGMKTTYEQGDIFKFNGTCTATYSVTKDGVAQADEIAEVTPTSVSTPNMNTIATQTVTVTYSEGGVEKTAEYQITITENTVTAGEYCITPNNEFWGTNFNGTISGDALNQVYTGRQDDITVQYSKGSGSNLYINNTQTRTYNGTALTIFAPNGYVITAIAFTADGSNWAGTHTANVGTMTDSKNWAGSTNEVTITFGGTCRVTKICVTYEAAPVEPVKTLTSIEITTPATQTTFWQGETFNYNGLVVTAHYSDAADEVVTPTVTGSTETDGTATVNVSYKEQSTSYTITVKAIPNTKETAYTVADAYDIIDKLTTANGVFISGTISQIDSYNDPYKSITYWISADGTTTKQLQVYSGKGLESADFAAVTDLSVGDQVIVVGKLKKYNSTYEFDANNYLASHTPTTKDPAGLAYATTSYTANVGDPFTTPELTNPHNLAVTYATSDASKATVDVNTGAVTIVAAGEVTITASTTGDAYHDAGSASYTITISNPAMAVATLPFTFNSGKADIENTAGMSQTGLDDDYNSAPKLKFNGAGDNVIVHFDSQAGEFSFLLKQNGQNAGTFTVYESANGEDYTPVWSGGDFGNAQSETIKPTLSESARYVKFEYTTKGTSTNYALGSISIAKPDNRADAGLAWNPTSVTLTQGDAFTAPTLSYPNSITGITYETSDDQVATVTSDGVIALGSATGTATITATFDGDATYKPATATCTITVNEYIETIDGEWELVTDASKLQAGMEIIIASVEVDGKYYTMSKASDNGNNRTAVESTISGEKLNPAVGTSVLTLVDAGNGTFALQAGNGKYLYAASSGSNYLKEKDEIDVNGQWTITIADNVATIKAEASSYRNWMQFNPNNGSPLFSCYAYDKPQKDIALYAKKPAHTRTTSAGRYGTICLPGNIVKCLGATLFEVAGKDGLRVVFDEVLTPEAGMPYIFLAHNAEVLFYCGDQTAAAGNYNSLYGTFSVLQDAQLDGMYMVQNNKIVKCAATGCGVAENRAYFNGAELEVLGSAPAPMPGRRRITMGTESENTTTGTEDVIAPEGQTLKLIENGQLIIIRDGVKFNAQGQKL